MNDPTIDINDNSNKIFKYNLNCMQGTANYQNVGNNGQMNYNNAPPPPRANNPYNNYQPGNFNGNPGLYVPPNQPNQGYPVNQPYIPNQGFIPGNNPGFIMGAGLMCPCCRRETNNFPKKVAGGVTWIWCFGLFIFTGICCCIPFCVDSCQDTELVCVACQTVKGRIEANCC